MTLIHVPDPCPPALSFLPERRGFGGPAVEYRGGEEWARSERGPYTIKAVRVSGTAPHVELFHPAVETGEPAVASASLPGVPRPRSVVMPQSNRLGGPSSSGNSSRIWRVTFTPSRAIASSGGVGPMRRGRGPFGVEIIPRPGARLWIPARTWEVLR
jgi:hypothetical protein